MKIIHDPPADGLANMARDEALLEDLTGEVILRIYCWSGSWVSYGYFQSEDAAKSHFPDAGLSFVKRPTGGGLVDHRDDVTYTLLIPRTHPFASLGRAECYRQIHTRVQVALSEQKVTSHLLEQEDGTSLACFDHSVPGDVIATATGRKLAGAAQRRTRKGLLHQGSISCPGIDAGRLAQDLAEVFADTF